jgi:3-isopropylmalate dehydrogenase
LVILRESTEGLLAAIDEGQVIDNEFARDSMIISRKTSTKLFDFAFNLAEKRKAVGSPGKVTCVDKADVLRSLAFFRQIFQERAALNSHIKSDAKYVDATALSLVRAPWEFDVLVMENMFGDILSDLAAGLVGGMGMAPSADIGDHHAVFQPSHGTAPDIAGTGRANPTATILSAAMMLDWLADRKKLEGCRAAAVRIERAIEQVFGERRVRPFEFGGTDSTMTIATTIAEAVMEKRTDSTSRLESQSQH